MVVALGTLHPDAEEQLRRHLCQALSIPDDRGSVTIWAAIIIGRRIVERAAARGQQFPHDFVPRCVAFDVTAEPLAVGVAALDLNRQPIRAQNVQPLVSPEIGKLGPVQELIDQPGSFARIAISEERSCFSGRGQDATQIQEDSTHEFLIRTHFRRQDVKQLELRENMLVQIIVCRGIGPGEVRLGFEIGQPDALDDVEIAAQDGSLTRLLQFDKAVGVNRGDSAVTATEGGQPSDIPHAAVSEMGQDRQLLPAGWRHLNAVARQDFQLLQCGQGSRIIAQSLGQPAANRLGGD
jgi:hypothetical protein